MPRFGLYRCKQCGIVQQEKPHFAFGDAQLPLTATAPPFRMAFDAAPVHGVGSNEEAAVVLLRSFISSHRPRRKCLRVHTQQHDCDHHRYRLLRRVAKNKAAAVDDSRYTEKELINADAWVRAAAPIRHCTHHMELTHRPLETAGLRGGREAMQCCWVGIQQLLGRRGG